MPSDNKLREVSHINDKHIDTKQSFANEIAIRKHIRLTPIAAVWPGSYTQNVS